MIIGVTGLFGSGKTFVSGIFAKYGYRIINADKIGHALLNKEDVRDKVTGKFGTALLTKGKIDRRKLKDIVFYDHKKLKQLNRIMHPLIIDKIERMIKKSKNRKIVVDGALLIEVGCLRIFDKLVVMKIKRKMLLKRTLKRKKYTRGEIYNIIKSQMPQKEKLKYADYIVDNNKGLEETKKQVFGIIKDVS
jgi:dephospho-CoA kinase